MDPAFPYENPICPYFGRCGGCRHQDQPYAAQVAAKEAALRELFGPWWPAPLPVAPSPTIWHYRNKAEFKFDRRHYPEPPPPGTPRETVLGFRQLGQWYSTLELEECRLVSPTVGPLLRSVRQWFRERGYRWYDQRRHRPKPTDPPPAGLLKNLVFRESKRPGQHLVLLLTAHLDYDRAGFAEAVLRALPEASVVAGADPSVGDAARATELEVLAGPGWLEEELHIPDQDVGDGGSGAPLVRRYRISPLGFFQVNPRATEQLYGTLRAWARSTGRARLHDLYGGAGGIGIACSDLFDCIRSVEEFPGAAADGRTNCELNGVSNIAFESLRVERWLAQRKVARDFDREALTIVDPPRAGLQGKALRRLLELAPEEFLYVACQPEALARELPAIAEAYEPHRLAAFDLFPHTPHVEVAAHFRRRATP